VVFLRTVFKGLAARQLGLQYSLWPCHWHSPRSTVLATLVERQWSATRRYFWSEQRGEPQNSPNPRTGSRGVILGSPGNGMFDEQDVAGMWLKCGEKPW